ncbi:MAG: ATP-dependent DNA helicase RecG [Nocardioidaceae bacterium]
MNATITLGTKLRDLLGAKTAKVLATSFDIATAEQLLRHYPRRYADRGRLTDLSRLRLDEHVTVMARVRSVRNHEFRGKGGRRGGRNVRTEIAVTDGTGELTLTFFGQPWRRDQVKEGALGLFAGKVNSFRGRRQLMHPEMHLVGDEDEALEEGLRLSTAPIPIYPASARISSWTIQRCVSLVLEALGDVPDVLPDDVRERLGLWDAKGSYEAVHRPRNANDYRRGRERFTYEEAFVLQTVLARRRHETAVASATARPYTAGGLRDEFVARLPFELTDGQRRVVDELVADLADDHPMHRLLQGEVGSGKTVVALLAMLQVVDAGGQAALLAPTEVLAQQHHRSITAMLGDLSQAGMLGGAERATRVRLLTGSMGAKARRESMLDVASGQAGIVVGTHALLEEAVQFADLGLVVVDEQHRFGVEQRAALGQKSATQPHVLVMTATPIPRTVAMTTFGDLETSTLTELPRGRQPIQTTVVPAAQRPAWLERSWQRVREEVGRGRQAYVVCARIGDGTPETDAEAGTEAGFGSDPDPADGANPWDQTRSVLELHAQLVDGPLAGLRVAVLHGRMPSEDKDEVMTAFAAHRLDVLVATTVIEVGVDVPNATAMVVMDADRFGVSQLHQLRGRVGRGSEAGLCLLVTGSDEGSPARQRLDAVAATSDGFELSRIDVELRREGDVLGARQSGVRSSLRLLSVVRDVEVIEQARRDAAEVVEADPGMRDHPALNAAVLDLELSARGDYLEKS